MNRLIRFLRVPLDDYLRALHVGLTPPTAGRVGIIVAAFVVSWWVYVPLHELLHAFGCMLAGGTVTRLEIDPLYGAALLQRVFPFIAVGSQYAGQLTGFDTHQSDLIYLATDAAPFTLTVFIGIPLLRSAGRDRLPWRSCLKMGVALPVALAPFISVVGDYYEMGSILVSRAVALWSPDIALDRWRSDDVVALVQRLFASAAPFTVGDVIAVSLAFLAGVALAFATYGIGALWAGKRARRSV